MPRRLEGCGSGVVGIWSAGIPGCRAVRGSGQPQCRESGVQGCLVCRGSAVQERVSFRGPRMEGSPERWGCGAQGIRGAGVERGAGLVWCVREREMPGIRGAGDPGHGARGSGMRGRRARAAVRVAGHAGPVKGRAAPGLLLQERRISGPRLRPWSRVGSLSAGLSCFQTLAM